MIQIYDFSALFTAFMVGLLGSGHCFGMCGGIAAGLGTLGVQNTSPAKAGAGAVSAILFNFSRIISYIVLGGVSAWLLAGAGAMLNIPAWSMALRLLTALMILLIGLQFLFDWQTLAGIERVGARVWKRVLPVAVRASKLPGGSGRMLLGLCWGFLPCGLVYSVVLTASSTGSAFSGALVMLAFGVGTLPSMLGLSLAAPSLAAFLSDRWTKRLMGAALVLLAVLSIVLMVVRTQGQPAGAHQHHARSETEQFVVDIGNCRV